MAGAAVNCLQECNTPAARQTDVELKQHIRDMQNADARVLLTSASRRTLQGCGLTTEMKRSALLQQAGVVPSTTPAWISGVGSHSEA